MPNLIDPIHAICGKRLYAALNAIPGTLKERCNQIETAVIGQGANAPSYAKLQRWAADPYTNRDLQCEALIRAVFDLSKGHDISMAQICKPPSERVQFEARNSISARLGVRRNEPDQLGRNVYPVEDFDLRINGVSEVCHFSDDKPSVKVILGFSDYSLVINGREMTILPDDEQARVFGAQGAVSVDEKLEIALSNRDAMTWAVRGVTDAKIIEGYCSGKLLCELAVEGGADGVPDENVTIELRARVDDMGLRLRFEENSETERQAEDIFVTRLKETAVRDDGCLSGDYIVAQTALNMGGV